MITRQELKNQAKEQLKGRWGLAIGGLFIYTLIISIPNIIVDLALTADAMKFSIVINIVTILIGGVMSLGISKFLLNFSIKGTEVKITDIFSGFNTFLKATGLFLLTTIIIFIGTFLLIVPGIIFAIMFSQVYYILAEDTSKSIKQCLVESKEMMIGHKMDYFILELSFIGWGLLCILTCGIGFLWLTPYISVTETNFYLELKNNNKMLL